MAEHPCPLCGDARKMKRPRELYGHMVCKRCWGRFITRRQFAWIVDVFSIWFVTGLLIGLLTSERDPEAGPPGALLLVALYGGIFFKDGFAGQSLGKWVCGVQVVDRDSGAPTGFVKSLLRNCLLAIPFMPLIVALTMNRGPRLGDGLANTRVVWKRYRDHAVFSPPAAAAKVFE